MDSETIIVLAREFCKEHGDSTIAYHAAKEVINFLLRRYFLVKKEAGIAELKAVDLSIKASLTFILKVDEVDMAKKRSCSTLSSPTSERRWRDERDIR